jgi:hypothetical protein
MRTTNPDRDYEFWSRHGGIVWSNLDASDSVMIANALLRPNFHLLLDIAVRFGLRRLDSEWRHLKTRTEEIDYPEEVAAVRRAAPIVERCIENMAEALRQLAAARADHTVDRMVSGLNTARVSGKMLKVY